MASSAGRCRKCGRMVALAEEASFIVLDGVRTDEAPLCSECAQSTASELKRAVAELREENESYAGLLQAALFNEKGINAEDDAALEAEEKALQEEVERLRKAVGGAEEQHRQAEVEWEKEASAARDEGGVEAREAAVWRVALALEAAARAAADEQAAVASRLARTERAVERLRRASVVNDTFKISHTGHVATINDLRLGRMPPTHDTDWTELNAAFGCTCQLVQLLARLLHVTFTAWQPVPLGSVSRMESLPDHTPYELYGSADLTLSRFFWYRRFDTAQVALAQCVWQLAEACEKKDGAFKLPYRITSDGGLYPSHVGSTASVSVRLQFNSPDNWSRALKYLLTDLKTLLTRV